MARINLIGTQHHEPLVEERVEDTIQNNDFDSIFLEGVDEETSEKVQQAVEKWTKQVSEKIDRQIPSVPEENGRFREAKAAENVYEGNITYLDSAKTIFLNTKDTIQNNLIGIEKGEISGDLGMLLQPDVTPDQVKALMRVYTPDPDLPYDMMLGTMDEDEYRHHLADSFVQLYREEFEDHGHEMSDEQIKLVRSNVLEKAPEQDEMFSVMIQEVYDNENEQAREQHWLEVFEENYDGEETAVFAGLGHLDEDNESFYNKLVSSGYEVDRYVLRDFTPMTD